jgi:hypothetical protein
MPKPGAAHYQQALALAELYSMFPLLAHCHLGMGRLSRGTGKPEQAREHFITATDMYCEMDMGFWLERGEPELSDSGYVGPRARLGQNSCPGTVAQARGSESVGTGEECETNLS